MPKILRIINRLNLGGPTYNAASLSAGLAPEFETLLLSGEKDDTEASSEFILRDMGIQPRFIKGMRREINFKDDRHAYRQIVNIIREFKPDIVHTHAAKAGTLGRLAAWREKVPVVVHTFHGHVFHSYFSPLKTRLFIGIERFLSGITDAVVTLSEEQKNDLVNIYKVTPESKTHIIPLGFKLQRFTENKFEKRKTFRTKFGLDESTIAVGIIGRLVPVKNHRMFLEAWKIFTERTDVKVHAFLVGDGEERQTLESVCSKLDIPYNTPNQQKEGATLTFTSWIEEVDTVMAGLDIVALTSLNEGTPVSLIEAQAAGIPVVSTRVGGIVNAVLENHSALLCESGDAETFASHLLKLAGDDSFRMRMAGAATAFVMDKYDEKRLVEDMRRLYHDLLNNKA
jgi:glycosyltransferase involved in cell wall biosynthesis